MKKTLLAAALMGVGVGVSMSAMAQSSVTLYGRIDNGIEYQTGVPTNVAAGTASSRWRVESGDWGTSMWGMKGVEDIGGGNKVVFDLEDGINTSTGTSDGGDAFSRFADVGIANDTYGTLLVGKQQWISNMVWDFDPLGQSNWSSASLVGGRNWPGSTNDVSYQTPTWGGFNMYGVYSLSDTTNFNGNTTAGATGRGDGLAATYTSTVFQVRGIYDEIRDSNGGFSDVYASSREYFLGVNVFLGPIKLQAAWQGSHAPDALGTAAAPSTTNLEWGGVTYTVNPAAAVTAAAYHVNANDGGGAATMYTLAGTYNLSKRTLLALEVASVHNNDAGAFGLNANPPGTGDAPLMGHSQTGAFLDIQHSF